MKKIISILLILSIPALINCNSSDDNSSPEPSNSSDDVSLSSTISSEATFSSPTATNTELSGSLTSSKIISKEEGELLEENPDDNFLKKKKILQRLLNPKTEKDCRFKPNFHAQGKSVMCYGPAIYYSDNVVGGSPGTMESQLKDLGGVPPGIPDTLYMYPGGDTGIWNAAHPETNEACSAAKINSTVAEASSMVGSAIGLAASMRCYAYFNGFKNNPAKDEKQNLALIYKKKMTENTSELTLSDAYIERKSENNAGNPVYVSHMKMTISSTDPTHPNLGAVIAITVTHSPADNNLFKGKVKLVITPENPPPDQAAKIGYAVLYSKKSASEVLYHVRRANSKNVNAVLFDDNDFIKYPENDGGNAIDMILNIDPSNGLGSFQSSWQAGNGDSHTRTFLAEIKKDGTGTAFFGFGSKIQTTDTASDWPGHLQGMFCNWLDHTAGISSLLQKQELKLNTTNGVWEASNSNITYAPLKSCDSTGFQYSSSIHWLPGNPQMDNDNYDALDVTNNLVALSEMNNISTLERLLSEDFNF